MQSRQNLLLISLLAALDTVLSFGQAAATGSAKEYVRLGSRVIAIESQAGMTADSQSITVPSDGSPVKVTVGLASGMAQATLDGAMVGSSNFTLSAIAAGGNCPAPVDSSAALSILSPVLCIGAAPISAASPTVYGRVKIISTFGGIDISVSQSPSTGCVANCGNPGGTTPPGSSTITLGPVPSPVNATGATLSLTVSVVPAGTPWTASLDAAALSFISVSQAGTCNGAQTSPNLCITVSRNNTQAGRSGTITIYTADGGNASVTLTQATNTANPWVNVYPNSISASPTAPGATTGTITTAPQSTNVTVSVSAGQSWTACSSALWLQPGNTTSSQSVSTVTISIKPNISALTRTGNITFYLGNACVNTQPNVTLTVNQSASTLSVNANTVSSIRLFPTQFAPLVYDLNGININNWLNAQSPNPTLTVSSAATSCLNFGLNSSQILGVVDNCNGGTATGLTLNASFDSHLGGGVINGPQLNFADAGVPVVSGVTLQLFNAANSQISSIAAGKSVDYRFSFVTPTPTSLTTALTIQDASISSPDCVVSAAQSPLATSQPYLLNTVSYFDFNLNGSHANGSLQPQTSVGATCQLLSASHITETSSGSYYNYTDDWFIVDTQPGTKTINLQVPGATSGSSGVATLTITPPNLQAPSLVSLLPQNATMQSGTLVATIQELAGTSYLDHIDLRVANTPDTTDNSICVVRAKQSNGNWTYSILASTPHLPQISSDWTPISGSGQSNLSCSVLTPAQPIVNAASNTVTITLNVAFTASFVGPHSLVVLASDTYGGATSGSTQLTVGSAPARPNPVIISNSTASGIDVSATFPGSPANYGESDILIGDQVLTPATAPPTTTNTCWVKYDYVQATPYLWQGSTNTWTPFSGSTATSASCTVTNLTFPSASSNVLSFHVAYSSGFFGDKQVWATASDRTTGAGQGIWYAYQGYPIPNSATPDCITSISPTHGFMGPGGGVGSITLTTPTACRITPTSDSPTWLSTGIRGVKSFTISGGTPPYSVAILSATPSNSPAWIVAGLCAGSTNSVCYSLTSNATGATRTATITVTDQAGTGTQKTFVVTQAKN